MSYKGKKDIFIIVLALLLIFIFNVSVCFAEDLFEKPMKKLSRGILNTAFGWFEIGQTACEIGKEEGIPAGLTYGLGKGFFFFIGRTAVGLYELVTFAVPVPKDYAPILKEPEFYPGEGKGLK